MPNSESVAMAVARGTRTLALLTESGAVFYDAATPAYVGIASDGVEVIIGHDERSAALYLAAHPTPDTW